MQPKGLPIPEYGAGLECPADIEKKGGADLVIQQMSILELIPEGFFHGKRAMFLNKVGASGIPVIGHSVELSLGTAGGFRQSHFDMVRRVLDKFNCVVYSDHLCFTTADGIEIGQLTTLPFTREVCDVVCRNIDTLQSQLNIPFLIENITNRFIVPENDLSEPEFINLITRRTGCGLLFDITNTFINSVNHGFNPYHWVDQIDAASIKGIHLAGGIIEDGVYYDSHSQPTPIEVLDLARYVKERASPSIVIVEWDQDTPPVERLIEEVRKAESIFFPHTHKQPRQDWPTSAEVHV